MSDVFFTLSLEGKVYRVPLTFRLIEEVEDELGSLAALQGRLRAGTWRAVELLTLMHILLQAAGQAVDYLTLGDRLVTMGLVSAAAGARVFLARVLEGEAK